MSIGKVWVYPLRDRVSLWAHGVEVAELSMVEGGRAEEGDGVVGSTCAIGLP